MESKGSDMENMGSSPPPAPEIVPEKSASQNRPTNAVTHSLSGLFSFLALFPWPILNIYSHSKSNVELGIGTNTSGKPIVSATIVYESRAARGNNLRRKS